VTGVIGGGLLAAAPARPAGAAPAAQPCPAPKQLVKGTHWHRHQLARGVVLREGIHKDRTVFGSPGEVDMHVLKVNLANPLVRIGPLVKHLAERQPLSVLAAGRRHLVAATNTGFFDFYAGAPSGPVFAGGRPLLLAARRQPVIGFAANRLAVPAAAWLAGAVKAGNRVQQVQSVNVLHPTHGLSVYTPAWGRINDVPLAAGRHTVLRQVRRGAVAGSAMHGGHVGPSNGELLVASTPATETWLRHLRSGTKVRTALRIESTSKRRLVEGFNVGKHLVLNGKLEHGLGCRERDTQAARTAVGFAHGGRTLIIAVVADHPCWAGHSQGCGRRQVHGLDHKEMARLMIGLGAHDAWQWDGSGSSELIARMPATHRLEIRNYCADGEERPMPVGFGIFSKPRH
jgi:hypothetical protein